MPVEAVTRRRAAVSGGWRIVAVLGCGYVAMALLVALLPSASTRTGPASHSVAAGAEVWRSGNCIACHAIYGLGGHLGPDLTNTISRLGWEGAAIRIAAGGGSMPSFVLSEEASGNLIAWLSYVDATGTYPLPRHFSPGFGDIR